MPLSHKRLATRRSSACAPDPWNKSYRDDIQSSSILTIVKVVQQQPETYRPSSPQRGRSFRGRSRQEQKEKDESSQQQQQQQRMTFAFNAFQPTQAGSPPTSPRIRPSSPHRSHRSVPQPRLGPDQLYDLAKTSIHNSQLPPKEQPSTLQPATFTPLPENIYLPFIDRPAEVSALISTHPSIKLFNLLSQTFTSSSNTGPVTDLAEIPPNPTEWTYAQLYAHLTLPTRQQIPDDIWVLKARKAILEHSELIWERVKGALGVPPELDVDINVEDWLRLFPPSPAPEPAQAAATPPAEEPAPAEEPTPDPTPAPITTEDPAPPSPGIPSATSTRIRTRDRRSSVSSIDTDDIPDDEGQPARGHWDDWDAVMESPMWPRPKSRLAQSIHAGDWDDVSSPVFQSYGDYGLEDEFVRPPSPGSLLTIEPLLVNPNAGPTSPTQPGQGLGDIQEGAEEEEEGAEEKKEEEEGLISPQSIQGLRISTSPAHHAMSPSALRSTQPLTGAASVFAPSSAGSGLNLMSGTPGVLSPISPYPGGVTPSPSAVYGSNPFFVGAVPPSGNAGSPTIPSAQPTSGIPIASKSRPGSGYGPSSFRRSGSFGSLGSLRELGNFSSLIGAGAGAGAGGGGGDSFSGSDRSFHTGYASGGEGRGPRFPSSFAQARRRAAAGHAKKDSSENASLSFSSAGLGIGRKPRTLSQSSSNSYVASLSSTALMASGSSSTAIPLAISTSSAGYPASSHSRDGSLTSPIETATTRLGGSVAGYKRLSWGPQVPSGLSVQAQGVQSGEATVVGSPVGGT